MSLKKFAVCALWGAMVLVLADAATARPSREIASTAPAVADDRVANAVASAPVAGATGEAVTGTPSVQGGRVARSDRERAAGHGRVSLTAATGNSLVENARRYMGGNPTGRGSAWCGAFLDMVLKQTGHQGGGNLARGYAKYGQRVSGPQVGAIAVMRSHVGVVSGVDPNGNPIVISGN
ncbi:MAG: TIGR02594 family protein, partial [Pseudolabrys sp.]|nr:TIGR02594 family protein [Pseudolabrys sp.]